MSTTKKGFTLVELLVVIGLIGALAAITIVAINPAQRFADARDAERQSEVSAMANAFAAWLAASNDVADLTLAGTDPIATCGTNPGKTVIGTDGLDLATASTGLVAKGFLNSVPQDPTNGTVANTGYTICNTGTSYTFGATPEGTGVTTIAITI